MTATIERQGTATSGTGCTPSLAEVERLVREQGANCIPIYREVLADLETPVSAYLKVAGERRQGFLLESVEGGERIARYSFIGTDPLFTLRLHEGRVQRVAADGTSEEYPFGDPLTALQEELSRYRAALLAGLPRFSGGVVGYLGYEAVRYFEDLPAATEDALGLPEGCFLLADALLVFDHVRRRVKAVAHVLPDAAGGDVAAAYAAAEARVADLLERLRAPLAAPLLANDHPGYFDAAPIHNTARAAFEAKVRRAKEYIAAGDIFQVVLSQRVDRPTAADPFTIYRALRAVNPSPYMYFLQFGDFQIVGASPELLVRLEDGVVTNHPIAGTYPRGADEAEDAALAAQLLADEKERAEHVMLVDLGRNDIGRVSVPGTVRVPTLLAVEKFSHVMHLVSVVEGELQPELTGLDALRACFPAGTVSGAPKIRAMEIIAELERDRRGPYSGAVGYVSFDGTMDTCITLRTMVVKDGIVSMQAGAGIVADSDPGREYEECFHKLGGNLRAVALAEELVNDEG
jgi:anthranilate synthase component 1